MNLYVMKDEKDTPHVFVEYGQGYMLCIGTKVEVDEALAKNDLGRVATMVQEAVAHCKFRSIEIWNQPTH